MQINQDYSSLASVFIQSPLNRRRLEEQGTVAPVKKDEAVATSYETKQSSDHHDAVAFNEKYDVPGATTANTLRADELYAMASSTLWYTKHSSTGKVSAYVETYNQPSTDAIKEQFSFSTYA